MTWKDVPESQIGWVSKSFHAPLNETFIQPLPRPAPSRSLGAERTSCVALPQTNPVWDLLALPALAPQARSAGCLERGYAFVILVPGRSLATVAPSVPTASPVAPIAASGAQCTQQDADGRAADWPR